MNGVLKTVWCPHCHVKACVREKFLADICPQCGQKVPVENLLTVNPHGERTPAERAARLKKLKEQKELQKQPFKFDQAGGTDFPK